MAEERSCFVAPDQAGLLLSELAQAVADGRRLGSSEISQIVSRHLAGSSDDALPRVGEWYRVLVDAPRRRGHDAEYAVVTRLMGLGVPEAPALLAVSVARSASIPNASGESGVSLGAASTSTRRAGDGVRWSGSAYRSRAPSASGVSPASAPPSPVVGRTASPQQGSSVRGGQLTRPGKIPLARPNRRQARAALLWPVHIYALYIRKSWSIMLSVPLLSPQTSGDITSTSDAIRYGAMLIVTGAVMWHPLRLTCIMLYTIYTFIRGII